MITRIVNGIRIEMTPEEVVALEASRPPKVRKPYRANAFEVLQKALKDKGVLTNLDLDVANTALVAVDPKLDEDAVR